MLAVCSDQRRATARLGPSRALWGGLSPESCSAVHGGTAVE